MLSHMLGLMTDTFFPAADLKLHLVADWCDFSVAKRLARWSLPRHSPPGWKRWTTDHSVRLTRQQMFDFNLMGFWNTLDLQSSYLQPLFRKKIKAQAPLWGKDCCSSPSFSIVRKLVPALLRLQFLKWNEGLIWIRMFQMFQFNDFSQLTFLKHTESHHT